MPFPTGKNVAIFSGNSVLQYFVEKLHLLPGFTSHERHFSYEIAFRDIRYFMPRSVVKVSQLLGGKYCLHLQACLTLQPRRRRQYFPPKR